MLSLLGPCNQPWRGKAYPITLLRTRRRSHKHFSSNCGASREPPPSGKRRGGNPDHLRAITWLGSTLTTTYFIDFPSISLHQCGVPAGMMTMSPALIRRITPPSIEVPLTPGGSGCSEREHECKNAEQHPYCFSFLQIQLNRISPRALGMRLFAARAGRCLHPAPGASPPRIGSRSA